MDQKLLIPYIMALISLPQNCSSRSSISAVFRPAPPFNGGGQFKVRLPRNPNTRIYIQGRRHPPPPPPRKYSSTVVGVIRSEGLESREEASSNTKSDSTNKMMVVVWCGAATAVLAVANRVLNKLALVPMKDYPFLLAQLTTFGHVAIYFSVLYMRYRAGIVTDDMLAIPKLPFVLMGMLEALGVVAAMCSAAMLPGPAIPILNQTFLVWQLAFSTLLLGRKYPWNKVAGCLLVAAGVVVAVGSGSDTGQMLSGIEFGWPLLMIASNAFQAGAYVLKGKLLDIFVVNAYASVSQALVVLLFPPFQSNLKVVSFSQLPLYLKSGAGCFLNTNSLGCDGAPLLPLLYIVTNIAFNISVLNLLKISSAVITSLVVMSSVPVSIYILSLPLPYLPQAVSLSSFFLLGTLVLVMGLILYNIPQPLHKYSKI